MKLLKKLLPIATAASLTAVVVPMATSCKGNDGFGYMTLDTLANGNYQRLTAIKEPTAVQSEAEGLALYLNDVKENNDIMVDDIMQYIELIYIDLIGNLPSPGEYDLAGQGEIGAKVLSIDTNENRVSVEVKLDLDLTLRLGTMSEFEDINIVLKGNLKFNDLQFTAKYLMLDEIENRWLIQPNYTTYWGEVDPWLLINDKKWSADISLNGQSPIFEDLGIDFDLSGHYDGESFKDEEILRTFQELSRYLKFAPNYMANVYIY